MDTQNPDNRGEFFDQFLDDYYAECDDHLVSIRRGLVTLEDEVDAHTVDRTVLDTQKSILRVNGQVALKSQVVNVEVKEHHTVWVKKHEWSRAVPVRYGVSGESLVTFGDDRLAGGVFDAGDHRRSRHGHVDRADRRGSPAAISAAGADERPDGQGGNA